MELDDLFDQPRRRRWWLLVKGLEYGNLEEALEFARAADDFVSTAPANLEVSPSLAMLDPSV